jgi:hypothetical protein
VSYGAKLGALMAAASVPVGFFRAHGDLKKLTIQEKLIRMNSFRVTGRALWGPMATFAAAGAAFAGAWLIIHGSRRLWGAAGPPGLLGHSQAHARGSTGRSLRRGPWPRSAGCGV